MTGNLPNCYTQADAVTNMIGFPEYILNATKLDARYNQVGIVRSQYCLVNQDEKYVFIVTGKMLFSTAYTSQVCFGYRLQHSMVP